MALDPGHFSRVLRVAMRIGANMLSSGAQTDDVEETIASVATALGLTNVQVAVTFSTISVSHDDPHASGPTTLLHLVKDRTSDFQRLAGVATIARKISDAQLDVDAAEVELAELEHRPPAYNRWVMLVAPGISAAASTVVFDGTVVDSLATFGIALAVQPALTRLDRSTFPPFFRLVFGAFASAALVAVLVGIGLPIVGGLVLTGSLLRFLPGYALVSGFRDLIGQSVISGTARLAEALLLAAGVAGGVAAALALAGAFDVNLTLARLGNPDWATSLAISGSFVAVTAFAVRLGVPALASVVAGLLGAGAWVVFNGVLSLARGIEPALATLVAAILIGIVGRLLARRSGAPSALWVVPAVLLLLPGLQIVQAMLARTNEDRIAGFIGAAATAFVLGVGVATGDIIVTAAQRLRRQVVEPAVDVVAGGVDVLVVTPVERAAEAAAQRLGLNRRPTPSRPPTGPTETHEHRPE